MTTRRRVTFSCGHVRIYKNGGRPGNYRCDQCDQVATVETILVPVENPYNSNTTKRMKAARGARLL